MLTQDLTNRIGLINFFAIYRGRRLGRDPSRDDSSRGGDGGLPGSWIRTRCLLGFMLFPNGFCPYSVLPASEILRRCRVFLLRSLQFQRRGRMAALRLNEANFQLFEEFRHILPPFIRTP